MNIIEKTIEWGGQTLLLTNQRAIYWKGQKTLILSDLHVGKAAHFRKNGIPIPSQVHTQDLDRLKHLIKHYRVEKVIIVGDMLHAQENSEVEDLQYFIAQFDPVEFILIRGNHDRISTQKLHGLGISTVCDSYVCQHITFTHEPITSDLTFQIVGHIHPGVSIKLPTKRHIRLAAYVLSPNLLVLPAFNLFTGLYTKKIVDNATYIAIHDTGIIEVINTI